jgi:hypothetical protein
MHPTTIGLDLAEHVFNVHGIDAVGQSHHSLDTPTLRTPMAISQIGI